MQGTYRATVTSIGWPTSS